MNTHKNLVASTLLIVTLFIFIERDVFNAWFKKITQFVFVMFNHYLFTENYTLSLSAQHLSAG